jgi:large subunit ribosomal protein L35
LVKIAKCIPRSSAGHESVFEVKTTRLDTENKGAIMPKMKSKSGAAKRFRALGSGKFKRTHAFLRHILTKKTTKRKRQLRGMAVADATNQKSMRKMLPYA